MKYLDPLPCGHGPIDNPRGPCPACDETICECCEDQHAVECEALAGVALSHALANGGGA